MGTFIPKSVDEYIKDLNEAFNQIIEDFKKEISEIIKDENINEEVFWNEYYKRLNELIKQIQEVAMENGRNVPSAAYDDYMKKATNEILKRLNSIVWGQ